MYKRQGYCGAGLADAVACGNICASPNPELITKAAQAVDQGKGVLFVYNNYAGDNLNFDMAEEMCRAEGMKTAHVREWDDLASCLLYTSLGAFFRYSISRKGNLVTLKDELDNIDNYMLIQRYRFGNRFSMEVIIDEEDEEAYNCLIPRLIIQPIVENAIFHGLEERLEGGRVTIEVIVTEKTLIITVSDNGKGISREQLNKLNAKIRSRDTNPEDGEAGNQRNTGIALPNIHKRIQLLFGEEYGVDIYSTPGQGTDVEVTIPVNYGHDWEAEDEERDTEDQRSELPS